MQYATQAIIVAEKHTQVSKHPSRPLSRLGGTQVSRALGCISYFFFLYLAGDSFIKRIGLAINLGQWIGFGDGDRKSDWIAARGASVLFVCWCWPTSGAAGGNANRCRLPVYVTWLNT